MTCSVVPIRSQWRAQRSPLLLCARGVLAHQSGTWLDELTDRLCCCAAVSSSFSFFSLSHSFSLNSVAVTAIRLWPHWACLCVLLMHRFSSSNLQPNITTLSRNQSPFIRGPTCDRPRMTACEEVGTVAERENAEMRVLFDCNFIVQFARCWRRVGRQITAK